MRKAISAVALVVVLALGGAGAGEAGAAEIGEKVIFYAIPAKQMPIGHGIDAMSLMEVKYKDNPCFIGEGAAINVIYEQVSEVGWDLEKTLMADENPLIKVVISLSKDMGYAKKMGSYPYQYWLEYFSVIDRNESGAAWKENFRKRLEDIKANAQDLLS